jgi:hypothetical protein
MGPDREQNRPVLDQALQQLRKLRRQSSSPLSHAFAALWSSALYALLGDGQRALREARRASEGLARRHHAYGTLASYWEGWLEGGESGRLKCEQVAQQMRAQGWSKPERAMTMLLPVFHLVPPSP